MIDHFSKKIFQYCIEKYELEEPVVQSEVDFGDNDEIENAIKDYQEDKNVDELRTKITTSLISWLTSKKETVNQKAVKQTVDKIVEVITKINS